MGYDSFKDTKTGLIYDNYIDLLNLQNKRIDELEENILFKDKEIKRIRKNWNNGKLAQRRLYDSLKLRSKEILKQCEQEKVSFLEEKLEELKDFCETWKRTSDYFEYVIINETSGIRTVPTLFEFIDEQIEKLNKGK